MSSLASAPPAVSPVRRAATVLLAAVTVAAGVWAAAGMARTARSNVPIDFLAFWAAGRLNAAGENPYDPARVQEVQLAAGFAHGQAVMMWNPPWLLAVVMPLGLLDPAVGHLVWQLAQLALVGLAADRLWVGFGGRPGLRWVGWLVGLGWAPTTFLVGAGQVTSLCLAGVALFLAARRAGRPGLAGAAAALTAFKPHLLALFGLALVLDAARGRAGRVTVLAGALVLAGLTAVAAAANPGVLGQYLGAVTAPSSAAHRAPADWRHPTPGSYLRAAVAPGSFAVQLVPLAAGAAAVAGVWVRNRGNWDWDAAAPWLVVGSLLAAPYGAWSYDLVLLLVPILAVAVRVAGAGWPARGLAGGVLVAVSGTLFACLLRTPKLPEETYVWVTPAVAAGVGAAGLVASRRPAGGRA